MRFALDDGGGKSGEEEQREGGGRSRQSWRWKGLRPRPWRTLQLGIQVARVCEGVCAHTHVVCACMWWVSMYTYGVCVCIHVRAYGALCVHVWHGVCV